jgi:serine/threonine protein kinase
MGVVYRGTDLDLSRPVAIKAIHDSRLQDGGAGRLRAEALAAAAIDHPYICKVYELIEEGAENFLVMEFIDGDTLSHRMRQGLPALPDTVRWASEVAEGLASAHARGIVHRDVKPSNVMITADGHVKLLDFGLAREDVVATPFDHTRTSPSDRSGYAGTPQYMSPEQAAGTPVTARADLFSLGVVIYECLTGRLPFQGTSPYDYVRHLLSDAPRRLDRLAPEAPEDLVQLVEHCLEKTPGDRPESAAAVLAELRKVGASLTTGGAPFDTSSAVRAKKRWRAMAAVVTGLAMALAMWLAFFSTPPPDPLRRSRAFVTLPSEESNSRVSPDGRWVSFISTRDGAPGLFVQAVDGSTANPVSLTTGRVTSHGWSPDGTRLVCTMQRPDGLVLQVFQAFFGGAAEATVELPVNSADVLRWVGRRVFLETTSGQGGRFLEMVDLDTKEVVNLSASWTPDGTLFSLDVRPDGRMAVMAIRNGSQSDLWTTPIDAWRPTRITNDAFYAQSPIWTGSGGAIIYSTNRGGQNDLWEYVVATGRHRSLTSSQTEERPGGVASDDRLVSFEQNSDDARIWLVNPAVRLYRQLTADALSDSSPSVSADGRRVVFQRALASPSQGYQLLDSKLLVADLDGTSLDGQPLVLSDGFAGTVSPDGRHVAYLVPGGQPGRAQLMVREIGADIVSTISTTTRLPVLALFPMDWAEQLVTWHPDRAELFFVEQQEALAVRRYRLGADAPSEPFFRTAAGGYIRDLHVSADGRQLGFLAWGSDGEFEAHAIDLATGADTVLARIAAPLSRLFGRGWLADGSGLVLVETTAMDAAGQSADLAVTVVRPGRAPAVVASVTGAFAATSRFDARAATLYVTRAVAGVHNVFAVPLDGRAPVAVTDNALPGVTFTGISPLPDGRIITVQNQRKRDIWVIEQTGGHP